MSATPIFTSPNDLWTLGKLLAVPGFTTDESDGRSLVMQRELARAHTEWRAYRDSEISEHGADRSTLLRELQFDDSDHEDSAPEAQNLRIVMEKQTVTIRAMFTEARAVICRPCKHDIPPHREVIILAEPSEYEIEKIAALQQAAEDTKQKVRMPCPHGARHILRAGRHSTTPSGRPSRIRITMTRTCLPVGHETSETTRSSRAQS
jgi:hypothetical protein